jgi:3-oxoacyl-[acyl-carrier-protein] synthase-3
MLPVKISSTGCYIPTRRVESTELDIRFGFKPGQIEELTGVGTRYYGNETETAPYMGARAVADALQRADLSIGQLDAVISVSGTSAQLIPCTASLILQEMGELDAGIAAFDFNATCLSFIAGFDAMAHLIAAGRYKRVVLVAAEAISPMLNPQHFESAALIGDGAAAVILEPAASGESSAMTGARLETYPRGIPSCQVKGLGTTLHPNGTRSSSEDDNYFFMDGQNLFRLTYALMPGFVDRFMNETKQCPEDFDFLIPHQASGPAVKIMLRRYVPPGHDDQIYVYLKEFGNVGAASIPFGIHLAIDRGRVKRGDRILLVGTGAGLSLGAASFVY